METRKENGPPRLSIMEPYLYLDFDGVLHPNFVQKGQAFHLMPLLEEALEGYDLCLVISSSWRFHETPAYLRNLFPASLRPLLIGATGPAHIGRRARWQEITHHAQSWAPELARTGRCRHGVSSPMSKPYSV